MYIVSSLVSSPSNSPLNYSIYVENSKIFKVADFVTSFPAQGTRQFGAWDINSACTVTEVGPQRAVDEPLYNK